MDVQPAAVDLSLAEMWSSSISLEPLRWRIKMGKYPDAPRGNGIVGSSRASTSRNFGQSANTLARSSQGKLERVVG
jgi:hypothetical protein